MIEIDGHSLTLEAVIKVAKDHEQVKIADSCIPKMERSYRTVEGFVNRGESVYGVTTGFGALSHIHIPSDQTLELQKNLILSHAAGVGDPLDERIVRSMILIRANSLVQGFSGVRVDLVRQLLRLLNHRITPIVPSQGSVGASGDLAPLAHIAMVLMGEGEVYHKGVRTTAQSAMNQEAIAQFHPCQKEGLALLNGTQLITSLLLDTLWNAYRLFEWALVSASMSSDALRCSTDPFEPILHEIRPHPGQAEVARVMLRYLQDSEIRGSHVHCEKVQDAYSIRACPQVLGAVKDTFDYIHSVAIREANSVTDNPIIAGEKAYSGGNFHGEPVAMVADFMSIALSELGSITERRIDRLVNPLVSLLPPFLAKGAEGINSGYMIWQYTAAALASENKSLSFPGSVDSIPTSGLQEDHVSMGPVAAHKAGKILDNCKKIVAIELMLATRALQTLAPMKTGLLLQPFFTQLEQLMDPYDHDRFFGNDYQRVFDWMGSNPVEHIFRRGGAS